MFIMAIASVLVSLPVTSIYYMIPSLLIFGLSNTLIHTPLMPEMGSIVSEMVNYNIHNKIYLPTNNVMTIGH